MLASLPLCSQECVCIWEGAFVVARVRPSTRGCVCVLKRVRLFARVYVLWGCCVRKSASVCEGVFVAARMRQCLQGCVCEGALVHARLYLNL